MFRLRTIYFPTCRESFFTVHCMLDHLLSDQPRIITVFLSVAILEMQLISFWSDTTTCHFQLKMQSMTRTAECTVHWNFLELGGTQFATTAISMVYLVEAMVIIKELCGNFITAWYSQR